MKDKKKVVFLTGTRADFGKIKSLLQVLECHEYFDVFVFVTGMHLMEEYGYTLIEIERCHFKNVCTFENHTSESTMDLTLAKTVQGFSNYVKSIKPDLVVVHGDRLEALAGAIVGSLNNILVAHIEGGELSGTIDELIRHSVSKLSHLHFVSNEEAKRRLEQMGEVTESIHLIGSPDIDIMISKSLPKLSSVKDYYQIPFDNYAIAMFHPITTEIDSIKTYAKNFVKALVTSNINYVVIYPNNDLGSEHIISEYSTFSENEKFKVFPSIRFEYFLVLLKNAQFIIGNSSAGIREAPYYQVPTINIGTRQLNRSSNENIINVSYEYSKILEALTTVKEIKLKSTMGELYGQGKSAELFLELLTGHDVWQIPSQKQFVDHGK